jgi:hypothetical protein
MTVPDQSQPADHELVAYLLELLSEEDTERVELASISDDEVAARLRMTETDLVDDYVRGALTGATLARFQTHYMASPRRRENVERAAAFVRAIDRVAAADPAAPSPSESRSAAAGTPDPALVQPPRPRTAHPIPWRGLAAVAALVLLAGGTLMFRNTPSYGRSSVVALEGARSDRRAIAQRPGIPPGSPAAIGGGIRGAGKDSQPATSPAPSDRSHVPHDPALIALVLFPQTRGTDPLPVLVIPPGATRVALELRLESARPRARYRAGLKDPGTNQVVWRSDPITAAGSRDGASLSLVVPVNVLRRTHYAIELTEPRRSEIVESYAFSVVSR